MEPGTPATCSSVQSHLSSLSYPILKSPFTNGIAYLSERRTLLSPRVCLAVALISCSILSEQSTRIQFLQRHNRPGRQAWPVLKRGSPRAISSHGSGRFWVLTCCLWKLKTSSSNWVNQLPHSGSHNCGLATVPLFRPWQWLYSAPVTTTWKHILCFSSQPLKGQGHV